MPTVLNNHRERNLPLSYRLFSLGAIFLITLMIIGTFFAFTHTNKRAQAAQSFTFTAAGDYYAQNTATTANLKAIVSSGASFHLALGDLNENSKVNAAQWSSLVKSMLPTNFPFEIVPGRHDVTQISTYKSALPDHIGDVSATCSGCAYGQEYYFDYPPPPSTPLARFIMISPNQTIPGYTYNYNQGGADYNWVSNTIDAAHTTGIPWVIVGMHEYCFVLGTVSCKNQQLLDLLLTKHVDVILQAQRHNYQQSKQLALNPTTCATLNVKSYNANCIADAGNSLTQGKGSVIVLTGTGGAPLLTIPPTDPKAGYFNKWEDSIWGISQFTISATQLTEQFVATSGGSFSDSFSITAGGGNIPPPGMTPSPSISPSPNATPSVTPSAAPGSTLAQDSFARPNQTFWGNASGGQTWGANANSSNGFYILNNIGLIVGSSSSNYFATLGPTATNAQVKFTGSVNSFSGANMGDVLRWADNQHWYAAYIDGTNLIMEKNVGGTITRLGSPVAFAATGGTSYTLLFSISGNNLSASVWPTGGSQPGNWMLTVTDSSLSSGTCGLQVVVQNGTTVAFNSFLATSH